MYSDIKRLYLEGRLTIKGLRKAIEKGWITESEFDEIIKDDE